jgi:hypothetical protein
LVLKKKQLWQSREKYLSGSNNSTCNFSLISNIQEHPDILFIEIWEKNVVSEDAMIGAAELDISTVYFKGPISPHWVMLKSKQGGYAGKVEIGVEWIEEAVDTPPQPHSKPSRHSSEPSLQGHRPPLSSSHSTVSTSTISFQSAPVVVSNQPKRPSIDSNTSLHEKASPAFMASPSYASLQSVVYQSLSPNSQTHLTSPTVSATTDVKLSANDPYSHLPSREKICVSPQPMPTSNSTFQPAYASLSHNSQGMTSPVASEMSKPTMESSFHRPVSLPLPSHGSFQVPTIPRPVSTSQISQVNHLQSSLSQVSIGSDYQQNHHAQHMSTIQTPPAQPYGSSFVHSYPQGHGMPAPNPYNQPYSATLPHPYHTGYPQHHQTTFHQPAHHTMNQFGTIPYQHSYPSQYSTLPAHRPHTSGLERRYEGLSIEQLATLPYPPPSSKSSYPR